MMFFYVCLAIFVIVCVCIANVFDYFFNWIVMGVVIIVIFTAIMSISEIKEKKERKLYILKLLCGALAIILLIIFKHPILLFIYLGIMCLVHAIISIREDDIPMAVVDVVFIFAFVRVVKFIMK